LRGVHRVVSPVRKHAPCDTVGGRFMARHGTTKRKEFAAALDHGELQMSNGDGQFPESL
jgi:hypothetical protein